MRELNMIKEETKKKKSKVAKKKKKKGKKAQASLIAKHFTCIDALASWFPVVYLDAKKNKVKEKNKRKNKSFPL